VSKGKLAKFAEINTYSNVIQAQFNEVFKKDFRLKGNWNKIFFKCAQPITLELGCGKGDYTIGLAQLFPNRNFIGIDIKGSRIWTGARKSLHYNYNNVGFLRTRIEFIDSFFALDEVREIWITFPDPQPKKSKKRLTSSHFLNQYRKFLNKNGWINLKTDNSELFNYTRALAAYNKFEVDFATNDLYASTSDNEIFSIKTYYERIWLNQGLKIHYMRFRFSGDDVIEEPPEQYLLR
jgi:tRNA (guanine-N7-)-methyltransferase